ncbi:MAG: 16S rRNA (cytidine(1402)-2'-O)-methyltransferase [bacterium]|nr:16S rRNA (cytidine(1402)-2'-O)-methyltransferase [bacterium]
MPVLYIVATPIGNLEDISMRALRVLGEVDFILCEDTRVTRILLERYKINTRTISYHQHSGESKINEIIGLLSDGKNLALVSDAGTPGISDPGGKLIQTVIERLDDAVQIESVPGPSAITAALSISGIPTDKFIFMGFPPHKKGRQTFIRKIVESEWPVVVYESKHRIIKFLAELELVTRNSQLTTEEKKVNLTSVVVVRELSKMHETVYRGDLKNIKNKIAADPNAQKGEFVVIIGK